MACKHIVEHEPFVVLVVESLCVGRTVGLKRHLRKAESIGQRLHPGKRSHSYRHHMGSIEIAGKDECELRRVGKQPPIIRSERVETELVDVFRRERHRRWTVYIAHKRVDSISDQSVCVMQHHTFEQRLLTDALAFGLSCLLEVGEMGARMAHFFVYKVEKLLCVLCRSRCQNLVPITVFAHCHGELKPAHNGQKSVGRHSFKAIHVDITHGIVISFGFFGV